MILRYLYLANAWDEVPPKLSKLGRRDFNWMYHPHLPFLAVASNNSNIVSFFNGLDFNGVIDSNQLSLYGALPHDFKESKIQLTRVNPNAFEFWTLWKFTAAVGDLQFEQTLLDSNGISLIGTVVEEFLTFSKIATCRSNHAATGFIAKKVMPRVKKRFRHVDEYHRDI